MSKYYTFALFKLKNVKVAEETISIIERMITQSDHKDLAVLYYSY
jgi:hypothetical protein